MAGSQKVAAVHLAMTADIAQANRNIQTLKNQMQSFGRRADREANRVKYAFNKIRRAAQVVASAFIFTAGIRRLGQLAVSVEKAEDRLRLMEARFKQFGRSAETFQQVYNLSQKLGASLEETANGMTRLLVATKSIGVAQDRLLKVQENIFILGRAGGSSVEELTGGMRQLSQGLASGRLQGEELRSVLENIPLVAIEIAKQLKIDIGQIREFAKEGKITSEVIIRALEDIEIKFEDLPLTFAQQTQKIATEWDLLLAALGKSVPVSFVMEGIENDIRRMREQILGDFSTYTEQDLVQGIIDVEAKLNEIRADTSIKGNLKNAIFGEEEELLATKRGYEEALDTLIKFKDTFRQKEDVAGQLGFLSPEQQASLDAYNKALGRVQNRFATTEEKVQELRETWAKFSKELTPGQIFNIATEINRLNEDGLEEIKKRMPRVSEVVKEETEKMSLYAKRAAKGMQSAFADFFFDPLGEGLDGLLKNFVDTIRKILAEILASQIMTSLIGTTGNYTAFGNFLGFRAMGGPVTAGNPFLVGEAGPELFVPGSSGMIIPNHKLGGAGGVNVNYTIDARGADEAAVMARMIPLLERTKDITKNEVRHEMREGRFT